jgi:hypothetical protein
MGVCYFIDLLVYAFPFQERHFFVSDFVLFNQTL